MKRPTKVNCLKAPSNPKEPKMLTGSGQKAMQSVAPPETWGTRTQRLPVCVAGTNSFMSSERNMLNPSSRLVEAGVIARCAAGVPGRGSWKKRRPSSNRADRSCDITPPCRRADFQPVVRDEITNRTFIGGNCK
jgi:hypothetical protein